jgi:2-amino-4-hydroxy-6-hydroxymethyldihydropteridine diphosphokinase
MEIGFSLGSNLGDRQAHLAAARQRILDERDTTLLACSPLYETDPVGVLEEYRDLMFLNAVLIVDSPADAREWLSRVGRIEDALGRVRTNDRNAPRTIDIDILYANDDYIDDGGLTVPHPRWVERLFVVRPLADVRPDLVLTGAGGSVADVLQGLPRDSGVRRLATEW